MTLTLYFLRQFIPPFILGVFIFLSVFVLDKLFNLIDLFFNKGVPFLVVAQIFALFLPTIFPLIVPMAILLSCFVTFGRISEENELTAVRAGGIPVYKVFWLPLFFTFILSLSLIPFNTDFAPRANQIFRTILQTIVDRDPLIHVEPRKFFSVKNLKIFADSVDSSKKTLRNVFVFQGSEESRPLDRFFAREGIIESDENNFQLTLKQGQVQRYDLKRPWVLIHTTFGIYTIKVPLNIEKDSQSVRFRNISSKELSKKIREFKAQRLPTAPIEAENSLRYAIAFAPFALALVGIPLALSFKKGGKAFGLGVTFLIVLIYYLLLVTGLTLAEKGILPPDPALWIANGVSIAFGIFFTNKVFKK